MADQDQKQDQNQNESQAPEHAKINFEDILQKLTDKNAEQARDLAVIEAQYDKLLSVYENLQEAYGKQSEVIKAYEEKDAIRSDEADGSDA